MCVHSELAVKEFQRRRKRRDRGEPLSNRKYQTLYKLNAAVCLSFPDSNVVYSFRVVVMMTMRAGAMAPTVARSVFVCFHYVPEKVDSIMLLKCEHVCKPRKYAYACR